MLERHVFFDRDALLLLVFPSFLFFLLSMKGIKHLIITSAEYHGPWYLPSKHILKITPWSDMDPFILVLAALSVTDKYFFLLRIVPEMHTPGICKPHSATTPPHTHTSGPQTSLPCTVPAAPCSSRRSRYSQSSVLKSAPNPELSVMVTWTFHFIFYFWLLIWIGVPSSRTAVSEKFPSKGSVSFYLLISKLWAAGIVQWQEQLFSIHKAPHHPSP